MKTTFIYALKEPNTGEVRYIGKADDPECRFRKHLNRAPVGKYHSSCWINSLLRRSLQPALEILDEVPYEFWPQWEVAYIEFFRESGCDLTNATYGGEGISMTLATRDKIAAKAMGNQRRLGQKQSAETKGKIASTLQGHEVSETTRQKISQAKKGRSHPGGKHSPEASERHSAAGRLRWEKKRQEEILDEMWQ